MRLYAKCSQIFNSQNIAINFDLLIVNIIVQNSTEGFLNCNDIKALNFELKLKKSSSIVSNICC